MKAGESTPEGGEHAALGAEVFQARSEMTLGISSTHSGMAWQSTTCVQAVAKTTVSSWEMYLLARGTRRFETTLLQQAMRAQGET